MLLEGGAPRQALPKAALMVAATLQPRVMPVSRQATNRVVLAVLGLAVAATWAGLRDFATPPARLAAESDVAFVCLTPGDLGLLGRTNKESLLTRSAIHADKPGSRPLLDEDAPPAAETKTKLRKGEETEEMQFDRVKRYTKFVKNLKGKFVPVGPKPWEKHRFMKVCISVQLEAKQASNTKVMNQVIEELRRISGKHPFVTKSKVNNAMLGWRKGADCGAGVNIYGSLMTDFLDRLNTIVLPRIRDFEGLVPNSFDKRGNFRMRIHNQEPFKELDELIDEREIVHAFDIGIVNNCFTQPDGLKLMKDFGFPFGDARPPKPPPMPIWKQKELGIYRPSGRETKKKKKR
eukprot:TRINITY_DN480_c0_g1_i1.p1 TRINITY_DN480_c0_g1~~TRINITY_DN480_c0_g1_i1.p1  ORF type:complete len:348 (-),score=81.99 TRINITY_DN480_c0_g1_i1:125-1168(-)